MNKTQKITEITLPQKYLMRLVELAKELDAYKYNKKYPLFEYHYKINYLIGHIYVIEHLIHKNKI